MFKSVTKYRSSLNKILLVAYLLSLFHMPVIEFLHFLSHANPFGTGAGEFHSYYVDHANADLHGLDHEHQILKVCGENHSETDHHSSTTNEIDLEKKVEISTNAITTTFASELNNIEIFTGFKIPTQLYLSVLVPPPQSF